MKKKFLSLMLALVLCLSLTVPAMAADLTLVEGTFPEAYDSMGGFYEGISSIEIGDKYGFIDKTGKEIIPCKYDSARHFSDGLAPVCLNGQWGFIDKAGKEVVPFKYDNADSFSEGLALVCVDNKWGYIDVTGEEVIPCKYDDYTESFSEGLASVNLNNKYGYIDRTGKEVIPCKYDAMSEFYEDYSVTMLNGKWVGYIVRTAAPEVTSAVSDWAKESVDAAAAAGLIADGLGEDYTRNITRAQFAAVSVKLYEAMSGETAPADSDKTFTDTSDPAVLQAAALGIVGGYDDGSFGPDDLVTREQAATMLSRVYSKLGGEIPTVDATTFADDGEVSGYARSAVAFMADQKIVGGVGDNKFDPQGNASIEQALVIALRMLENLK